MVKRTLILHCNIVKEAFKLLCASYITVDENCIAAIDPMPELEKRKKEVYIEAKDKLTASISETFTAAPC